MASRQSWKNEKKVRLGKEALTKTDFVYTLSTAILLHKMATVRFFVNTAVPFVLITIVNHEK